MRKLLFLLFIPLLISCGKDQDRDLVSFVTNDSADKIFKATGCMPTDAENVIKVNLYTDNQGVKYLYGSKNKEDCECFWFAQYDADGKQKWEIVNKGKQSTYASIPQTINNGSIVIGNVVYENTSFNINGIYPILIEPKSGKYKQIKVDEKYFYSEVFAFDRFFFCDISQKELHLMPNAKKWSVQIDNEGEIMYEEGSMNIPSGKAVFIDNFLFINMTPTSITKESIKSSKSRIWEFPIKLPENTKCEMELSLNEDEINAVYNMTLANGEQQIIKYKLSYTTGKEPVRVTGITLPSTQNIAIGEELYLKATIIPENASVTNVTWQSSDEDIASIDTDGKLKGISKGECTITATTLDGNYQAICHIQVKKPTEVSGILIDSEAAEILLGTTKQVTATVLPATAINKKVHWSSSDESIASVDQNGNITAKAIGTTNIIVQTEEGNYTATCVITVVDITRFINLGFSAAVIITDGYVSGSILSIIKNNSNETITITKMEITDGFNNMFGNASHLLPKTLAPGESYNLGSDKFNKIYYPIFLWYFEYEGKTYCVHHQFKGSTPNMQKISKKNIETGHVILEEK
ncbi:MAG: Ig-like domain-containing protein [Bacteroides intestinalis]|jgi:uncharacterized protein YjdB